MVGREIKLIQVICEMMSLFKMRFAEIGKKKFNCLKNK